MGDAAERLHERVLVVRCQRGDVAALSELIGRYSPRVRFYLRKLVGESAAEDLLQDVWVEVFAKVARLNDAGAFGGWVYRIARDKAYRELGRRRVPCAAVDEHLTAEAGDAEDEWTPEDVERVRTALDEMVPEHREVLVLRFVEDMKVIPALAEMNRNAAPPDAATTQQRMIFVLRALKEGTIATLIGSLASMLVAALCTVSPIIVSRRATLRQVNARLAEIPDQLKLLAGRQS